MPRPRLIGLCGYAGSGKSTVARIALHTAGTQFCLPDVHFFILSFASKLKHEVATALAALPLTSGYPIALPEGNLVDEYTYFQHLLHHPEYKKQFRGLMQWWGTEYRRAGDPDYWVKLVDQEITTAFEGGFSVVIDDVRYPNEVALVLKRGGFMYKVVREGTGPINDHSSERPDDLQDISAVIYNDGDLDQLKKEVVTKILF